jgi:hypothetical protein
MLLKLALAVLFVPAAMRSCADARAGGIPRPDSYTLERLVGNPLDEPIRILAWNARPPPTTNLFIYAASLPAMDEALMHRVAQHFGVKGEITQIKGDTLGHLGFWIRERNPTNEIEDRVVKFWVTKGDFSYSGGSDGHGWDLKNHKPLVSGVPSKEETKRLALELLSLLRLSTNDLAHSPDGRLLSGFSRPTIGYTDRTDKQRKRVVISSSVTFYQKIPGGGVSDGIGDGGAIRFSFGVEGKLFAIEWFFRKLTKAGEAKAKSTADVIQNIRKGTAWTWHQTVRSPITVTDCVLAYPQANSFLHQEYLWPFYRVSATDVDGRTVTLYVPLEW